MSVVHLKAVTRTQGNNEAVTSGRIAPRGFTLDLVEVPVLVQAFRRMVRQLEFDVCEMAITTYLCAKAHGKPFTALPIFLVRGFHHGAIVHSALSGDSMIEPADLAGRRVGVNRGYTVTTGVWARAILAEEYGLDLDQVTWVRSGDEHVAEYEPPANVVSVPVGANLEGLLTSGDLAAAVGMGAGDHPELVPLIPDPQAAALAALRSRGLYPINHLMVVRDDLLEAYPDLARAIFEAFVEAKLDYVERLRAGAIDSPTSADRLHQQVMTETAADPLPYGIAPNRAMLEQLIGHAMRQHIIDRAPDVDDLFAAGTRDLVG